LPKLCHRITHTPDIILIVKTIFAISSLPKLARRRNPSAVHVSVPVSAHHSIDALRRLLAWPDAKPAPFCPSPLEGRWEEIYSSGPAISTIKSEKFT